MKKKEEKEQEQKQKHENLGRWMLEKRNDLNSWTISPEYILLYLTMYNGYGISSSSVSLYAWLGLGRYGCMHVGKWVRCGGNSNVTKTDRETETTKGWSNSSDKYLCKTHQFISSR